MNKPLVYLACPYSAPTAEGRLENFRQANIAASRLMNAGEMILCPVSHSHPIAVEAGLPTNWEFWEKIDRAYLSCCYKMIVMMLPGWGSSKGVAAEIKIAEEFGIPITYLKLTDIKEAV